VQRKTVTVLFCDVTGSTTLGESVDPEALRGLLARYFERMKGIIERHGGSVEKFIGDAVMAVFGVPVVYEDDALRSVRAAVEMRAALPGLGLHARIGVNTGEVVTGTEERLATGDAVNVAARLEQAAEPDEILIGEPTLALVREAVEFERVEPLVLKGKAAPVGAYRLIAVHDAPERRHDARFVGRERELALIRGAWQRAWSERRCEVVTILGDAGVGKSRLVAELTSALEGTVVRGRCPPYGEGITYWPVVEMLRELRVLPRDEAAALSIRSLLREVDAATSAEEIAWGVRKTLEQAAGERPLAVVFDDIQWGEQTFLDLIEHIGLLSTGAPILVICLARPELTERRPAWPVMLRLEPLDRAEVEQLIPQRLDGRLRERIARAAGGNPLFVGEMVSIASEATGEVVVPPTLQALLAARLDQLDPLERSVLQRGAVEGEIFHRGAVQALAPGELHVTRGLAALVRKELIRPDRSQLEAEDGFRFRHLLIRDAAYDALSKATRAELHERFASWLEGHGSQLVELDEILGYHLEQACGYLTQLGSPPRSELRAAARMRLGAAGRRAYTRSDYRAAASLLGRAASFLLPAEIDLTLEMMLADALNEMGRSADALARTAGVVERARADGDQIAELSARIQEGHFRLFVDPESATEKLSALLDEALPVLEAAGGDGPYWAYYARAMVAMMHGHMDTTAAALDQALVHARDLATPILIGWRASARLYGATPVAQFLAWTEEVEAREPNIFVRRERATALAMLGRFDEARTILAEVYAALADRGAGIQAGVTAGQASVEVELLAGDPAAGVRIGEDAYRLLGELGERAFRSTGAALLARAYCELERLDEADMWADRAAELGASDDVLTQMLLCQVRARVLGRRGEHSKAARLAHEAVAIGKRTHMLNQLADSYADLAEVLYLGGRRDEAMAALEQALARYERKGNLVRASWIGTRLASLKDRGTRH
jgi:class 3 adenylate cyclase/tetratricopeptide (TPR) repeat protein